MVSSLSDTTSSLTSIIGPRHHFKMDHARRKVNSFVDVFASSGKQIAFI